MPMDIKNGDNDGFDVYETDKISKQVILHTNICVLLS